MKNTKRDIKFKDKLLIKEVEEQLFNNAIKTCYDRKVSLIFNRYLKTKSLFNDEDSTNILVDVKKNTEKDEININNDLNSMSIVYESNTYENGFSENIISYIDKIDNNIYKHICTNNYSLYGSISPKVVELLEDNNNILETRYDNYLFYLKHINKEKNIVDEFFMGTDSILRKTIDNDYVSYSKTTNTRYLTIYPGEDIEASYKLVDKLEYKSISKEEFIRDMNYYYNFQIDDEVEYNFGR